MSAPVTISHAGRHRTDVLPGRAARLGDGDYPLFKPPSPEAVAVPDECLNFLRELHVSLLPVFDVAARRWMNAYFAAIVERADAARDRLAVPAGMDESENAHRTWCYAAYRPFVAASCEVDGDRVEAAILFWLDDGPFPVRPEKETADRIDPRLLDYLSGAGAPHHPFVRRPLAGLGALRDQMSSDRQ
ncbi:MAG: hypothetical protein JJ899_01720 [Alphaproteobacteria bacterium]|nr:hypothetical protein [Alphaproteobacteria bacterium]